MKKTTLQRNPLFETLQKNTAILTVFFLFVFVNTQFCNRLICDKWAVN